MQEFHIPKQSLETTYEVKKSLFHCLGANVASREEAMAVVESARDKYPDAGHHCWAYLIGNPNTPSTVAFSDDGEPSGTAGKPILNVLQHNDVGDIVLVVSRYFGGTKLGAGGLVRAYSSAAVQTLEQLPLQLKVSKSSLEFTVDFKDEQFVRHLLDKYQGELISCDYSAAVMIKVELPDTNQDTFLQELQNIATFTKD